MHTRFALLFLFLFACPSFAQSDTSDNTVRWKYVFKKGQIFSYHYVLSRTAEGKRSRTFYRTENVLTADLRIDVEDVDSDGLSSLLIRPTKQHVDVTGPEYGWHFDRVAFPPVMRARVWSDGDYESGVVLEEDSERMATRVLMDTKAGEHLRLINDRAFVEKLMRKIFPYIQKVYMRPGLTWKDNGDEKGKHHFEVSRKIPGQVDPVVTVDSQTIKDNWEDIYTCKGKINWQDHRAIEIDLLSTGEGSRFREGHFTWEGDQTWFVRESDGIPVWRELKTLTHRPRVVITDESTLKLVE